MSVADPITLVVVSHPRFARYLRHCLESFAAHAQEPFEILILTESENVAQLVQTSGQVQLGPLATVRVAAMHPAAEAVQKPYMRQMAAKMLCGSQFGSRNSRLVITDDDTAAIAPWSGDLFFDAGGRAQIWYRATHVAFWTPGLGLIFGDRPARDFQLLLPFAIRRETLEELAASTHGERCMAAWHRNDLVSEFSVMGEWAWREPHRANRSAFRNILTDRWHWTLGARPAFRDWQAFRGSLGKRIARARL